MREDGGRRRRRRQIASKEFEPHIVMWGTKHTDVGGTTGQTLTTLEPRSRHLGLKSLFDEDNLKIW
jgi:hypothetical protein